MTAETRARDYLRDHHVLTLATHGPEGVWAAAVFYANDGFQLYFLSAGHTRHAQNIAASPQVAATIQEDYADWTAIKGIQLEGTVRMLAGKEREAAIALYAKKFSFLTQPISVVESALMRVNWYCLSPARLYFVDNSRGFGHRDGIDLDLS
ncbi:MAG: pyridoxamine 5'-phosphate oxidase family protein [Candidatus Promineofilum sp.]|nr:pyridoxamine 5'-phosphate oxidase family protein [Promineifilum sp.]